jgi:type III restriction enzyme
VFGLQGTLTQRTTRPSPSPSAKLLTPVPKPQKRRRHANQPGFVFDSGHGLSTEEQEYNPTPIFNEIRRYVENWRNLPNPDQWQVTPEAARLPRH